MGEKDAEFIISFFKSKGDEFDPGKTLTDTFFDVAANVQKVGKILCAHLLKAICFHGGERVLSLFFSDLSRIGAIKVFVILILLFIQFYLTL